MAEQHGLGLDCAHGLVTSSCCCSSLRLVRGVVLLRSGRGPHFQPLDGAHHHAVPKPWRRGGAQAGHQPTSRSEAAIRPIAVISHISGYLSQFFCLAGTLPDADFWDVLSSLRYLRLSGWVALCSAVEFASPTVSKVLSIQGLACARP